MALLEAGVWFGLNYLLREHYRVETISFITDVVNLIISFPIKKFFVFSGKQTKSALEQFVLSAVFLLISTVLVHIMHKYVNIQDNTLAKGAAAMILFFINYPINKLIVFSKKK